MPAKLRTEYSVRELYLQGETKKTLDYKKLAIDASRAIATSFGQGEEPYLIIQNAIKNKDSVIGLALAANTSLRYDYSSLGTKILAILASLANPNCFNEAGKPNRATLITTMQKITKNIHLSINWSYVRNMQLEKGALKLAKSSHNLNTLKNIELPVLGNSRYLKITTKSTSPDKLTTSTETLQVFNHQSYGTILISGSQKSLPPMPSKYTYKISCSAFEIKEYDSDKELKLSASQLLFADKCYFQPGTDTPLEGKHCKRHFKDGKLLTGNYLYSETLFKDGQEIIQEIEHNGWHYKGGKKMTGIYSFNNCYYSATELNQAELFNGFHQKNYYKQGKEFSYNNSSDSSPLDYNEQTKIFSINHEPINEDLLASHGILLSQGKLTAIRQERLTNLGRAILKQFGFNNEQGVKLKLNDEGYFTKNGIKIIDGDKFYASSLLSEIKTKANVENMNWSKNMNDSASIIELENLGISFREGRLVSINLSILSDNSKYILEAYDLDLNPSNFKADNDGQLINSKGIRIIANGNYAGVTFKNGTISTVFSNGEYYIESPAKRLYYGFINEDSFRGFIFEGVKDNRDLQQTDGIKFIDGKITVVDPGKLSNYAKLCLAQAGDKMAIHALCDTLPAELSRKLKNMLRTGKKLLTNTTNSNSPFNEKPNWSAYGPESLGFTTNQIPDDKHRLFLYKAQTTIQMDLETYKHQFSAVVVSIADDEEPQPGQKLPASMNSPKEIANKLQIEEELVPLFLASVFNAELEKCEPSKVCLLNIKKSYYPGSTPSILFHQFNHLKQDIYLADFTTSLSAKDILPSTYINSLEKQGLWERDLAKESLQLMNSNDKNLPPLSEASKKILVKLATTDYPLTLLDNEKQQLEIFQHIQSLKVEELKSFLYYAIYWSSNSWAANNGQASAAFTKQILLENLSIQQKDWLISKSASDYIKHNCYDMIKGYSGCMGVLATSMRNLL